nr:hypothetical protein [Tanacetum cinerariifolium]
MSDSEYSSVTYTSVPSPVEDYSDIGSPNIDGPPSPDYVPSLEEPEQAPLSPDYVLGSKEPEHAPPSSVYLLYVPELVYPEYMPPEDDVFLAEEQPLPVAAIPTADSPGYIPEFDPKGDLEEDDKEDPEEDPADYPADSIVVALPAVDHVPSKERDREARMARKAWGLSMDASDNAHSDVMSLRTTLVAQDALILDLQPADHRRHGVIKELLAADHKRQVQLTKALRLLKGLQTQMIEFQRHHGPAKDPA